MTTGDGFDRVLTSWLDGRAGSGGPDYLDETLSAIDNLHQRPAWAFPRRWLPASLADGKRLPVMLLVALLLVVLLVSIGLTGGRLRFGPRVPTAFPPPYGLAANGLLAFDSDGQIVLAAPDGSGSSPLHPSERSLVHPKGPAQFGATVSRDGTRVAYWQVDGFKSVGGGNTEPAADLWVVDIDGQHPVNLTPDLEVAPWAGGPAGSWSPDGSAFVFTSDKDAPMYVVRTDGRTPPRAIGTGFVFPGFPTWSPDGTRIAFHGNELLPDEVLGPPNVYVINADGTGQETVGVGDPVALRGLPQWSPDGRTLLYVIDTAAPPPPGSPPVDGPPQHIQIGIAERGSTGWTERLVTEPSPIWIATFSNRGDRIGFMRSRPGIFGGDLVVVGVDGSGERIVSRGLVNVSMPCWSPDDTLIAGLTGYIPPGGEAAGFGWPDQTYTMFPVDDGTPVEIPAGTVDGVFACSWQRLAP